MNRVSFTIKGLENSKRMLEELGPAAALRITRYACDMAMERVVTSAKVRARSERIFRTGLLAESIGNKSKVYKIGKKRRAGVVVVMVGPRTGFGKGVWVENHMTGTTDLVFADPVKYAHLVEFGTQAHSLGKGSLMARTFKNGKKQTAVDNGGARHPGSEPQPFMRPALESNADYVVAKMDKEIGLGLERELAKHAAKQAKASAA